MTNAKKFKSAEERRMAYDDYCEDCGKKHKALMDEFGWLELEYEEELKPCPFCGEKAEFNKTLVEGRTEGWVQCTHCGVHSFVKEKDEVITAWNRRVNG